VAKDGVRLGDDADEGVYTAASAFALRYRKDERYGKSVPRVRRFDAKGPCRRRHANDRCLRAMPEAPEPRVTYTASRPDGDEQRICRRMRAMSRTAFDLRTSNAPPPRNDASKRGYHHRAPRRARSTATPSRERRARASTRARHPNEPCAITPRLLRYHRAAKITPTRAHGNETF